MNHKHVSVCDSRSQKGDCGGATGLHVDFGRKSLVDQLYRGYGEFSYTGGRLRTIKAHLKMFGWAFVVNGAKFFKRAMDIVVSSVALVLFSPLFLVLAILIRLQDGGPALFWQMRVGLWGKE